MTYHEFQPKEALRPYLECYWMAEGYDAGVTQKIVPDGFAEIVFHYGDLYRFRNKKGEEKIQSRIILAGQITQPIFLTPTGYSGVIGLKFKPTGIWKLLGWNMKSFADEAIDLNDWPSSSPTDFVTQLKARQSKEEKIELIEKILLQQLPLAQSTIIDEVIREIDLSLGNITIAELNEKFQIPVRKMERLFNEQVGISAKRYSRIVRFRHVFQLLQKETWSKAEATYLAGYFDQAHFNKEFRTFSGEDPGSYFTKHHEFANFFLNRPVVFLQDNE